MAEEGKGVCPELTALSNCYNKLTLALPLSDIVPKLISQRVITISDKQKIMAYPSDAQKVGHFLDILSEQLSIGDTKNFEIFLKLLKQNIKGGFLAAELEKELEKARCSKIKKEDSDDVSMAYCHAGIPTGKQ